MPSAHMFLYKDDEIYYISKLKSFFIIELNFLSTILKDL